MSKGFPVELVYEAWLSTLDYVDRNAPLAWADMMARGSDFMMPPEVRALPRVQDRATALAKAEAMRLRNAELFYLDAAAGQAAVVVEPQIQNLSDLVPAPAGLIVWQEPPAHVGRGFPIRAASWGPAYDGGTWMSWWTDTKAAIHDFGFPEVAFQVNGWLTFHQESHVPPRGWPAVNLRPGHPEHGLFRALFSGWAAMESGAIEETDVLEPTSHLRKQAKRQAAEARPIHRFRPSSGEARPAADPRTIIERALGAYQLPDRPYPAELPAELAAWHCYVVDGGHSILVMLDPVEPGMTVPAAGNGAVVEGALLPAPVKAVLRAGWRVENGYIRTPVRYDPELGLLTDPEDDEF